MSLLPDHFEHWFAARGWSPRVHQLAVPEHSSRGESVLLISPAGGGKTPAGFLPSLVELSEQHEHSGIHTFYVPPLKVARVIRTLDRIIEWRGRPQMIRVDNGPEYISDCLRQWAEDRNIFIRHIEPGKPQQNAYVERYNRTVRHEWLGQYMFTTIEEVQDFATDWLWTYNNDRPNMGLGGITPAQKLKYHMTTQIAA